MTREAIQASHVLEADFLNGHVSDRLDGIEQESHDPDREEVICCGAVTRP